MYRTLSWEEFMAAMVVAHLDKSSGTLFFFTDHQEWGKVVFREGDISSLGYKLQHGHQALTLLRSVPVFQVRMQGLLLELLPKLDSIELSKLIRPGIAIQFAGNYAHDTTARYFLELDIDYNQLSRASTKSHPGARRTTPASTPQHGDKLHVPSGSHRFSMGAARTADSKTVLVVEDSSMTRRLISRALVEAGYRVLEAPDGFKALALLGNERVDLLVVDLIMPGIDGYKVITSVKQRERTRNLPIIILTSRDSLMDRLKGRLSASDEYLTKPFDPEVLVARVDYYLQG